MLKIKKKPARKAASAVTFETPTKWQKFGIELLITLNTSSKTLITAPEVDVNATVLVTLAKPHFFFNPTIQPKTLEDEEKPSTIIMLIKYFDYLGNEQELELPEDEAADIKVAIDYLNNGTPKTKRQKKNAE